MYRWLVRGLAAVTLLFSSWSALRIADLAIFDLAAPLTLGAALLCRRTDTSAAVPGSLKLPLIGVGLLLLGGYVALTTCSDTEEHIQKVTVLVLAFTAMATLGWVFADRGIFSVTEILSLLCLSGSIGSGIAILQGRLGMFVGLMPAKVEAWGRMSGLTQHPLEAGSVAAFSAVIALGLVIYKRGWMRLFILLAALNVYSMEYSASLTAVFAFCAAVVAIAIFFRAWLFLGVMATLTITLGGGLAVSSSLPGPLASRLETILALGGNYTTVQTRERQLRQTIEQIDGSTIFLGNGYNMAKLPDGKEIHNGFLAAMFHFGILGLASQCVFIWYFLRGLLSNASRELRGILLGCAVVFLLEYSTGPALARRTVWVPMFLIAAYIGSATSSRSRVPVGQTAAPFAPVEPYA
jgi:O-antigen ligase